MTVLPALDRREFLALVGEFDLPAPADAAGRLLAHYRTLCRWAPRMSLVGPAFARPEVVLAAYREALLAAAELAGGGRLLDVGSGAGFPGLVIGLALGERLELLLVEPRQRRAAFLQHALRHAGVGRVAVLTARVAHPLPSAFPERLDFLSLRAVKLESGAVDDLVARLHPGGKLLVWAGDRVPIAVPPGLGAPRELRAAGSSRRRVLVWTRPHEPDRRLTGT